MLTTSSWSCSLYILLWWETGGGKIRFRRTQRSMSRHGRVVLMWVSRVVLERVVHVNPDLYSFTLANHRSREVTSSPRPTPSVHSECSREALHSAHEVASRRSSILSESSATYLRLRCARFGHMSTLLVLRFKKSFAPLSAKHHRSCFFTEHHFAICTNGKTEMHDRAPPLHQRPNSLKSTCWVRRYLSPPARWILTSSTGREVKADWCPS